MIGVVVRVQEVYVEVAAQVGRLLVLDLLGIKVEKGQLPAGQLDPALDLAGGVQGRCQAHSNAHRQLMLVVEHMDCSILVNRLGDRAEIEALALADAEAKVEVPGDLELDGGIDLEVEARYADVEVDRRQVRRRVQRLVQMLI